MVLGFSEACSRVWMLQDVTLWLFVFGACSSIAKRFDKRNASNPTFFELADFVHAVVGASPCL